MQVILLEKVNRLGELGELVDVKAGYGRNFLIPQGRAVPATKENVVRFEERRAELEKLAGEKLAAAEKRADALRAVELEIAVRAGDEGKLFGSVGARDIVDAIIAKGVTVEKSEVRMPHGAIRQAGEFEIDVQVHSDIVVQVKLAVVPEA